jgi:excisionase family DNA binding protein
MAYSVDDLLTTKQLQALLKVDRVTIYRMLSDGRLRGFKVGGQWRFSRQEIEAWLQARRAVPDVAEGSDLLSKEGFSSSKVLPVSCVQAIQGVCAEALDFATVTIDLDGTPLAGVSNSCDFCNLILSTDEGQRRCIEAWKLVDNDRAHRCHAGLLCVSVPIEVAGNPVAITAGCQFSAQPLNAHDPTWAATLSVLAVDLGLSSAELQAAVPSVRVVQGDELPRLSRLLRRVADTFSEIGQERLILLSRLQHIAEMSKI